MARVSVDDGQDARGWPESESIEGSDVSASKRLSLNEIRARVAKFAVDYKDVKTEKQHTSDFWKAFMRCYGVEDSYLHGVTFEYPATRSDTGKIGYIDVFMPGVYLIEQKTDGKIVRPKGSEQSNAEKQANDYLTGGTITDAQMPRWVVTSDFTRIQITDLAVSRRSPVRTKTILTQDLAEHVETFLFLTGEDTGALIAEEQAEASVLAARLMGDLYATLTGDDDTGPDVENPEDEDAKSMEASVLLTRLLFMMFADDAQLWTKGMFERFIKSRTSQDGSDLGQQLTTLFSVLDTPEPRDKRMDDDFKAFPYVNGDLFDQAALKVTWFDSSMRDALLQACAFDWSRISPAVFGSLFQTIKSKEARRGDGEHYTSEANILRVLGPMFLDDMRKRLDAANTKPQLTALHEELKTFRYFDPACGCGNFLIVAYREMRAFELDLLVKLRTKQGDEDALIMDPSDMLHVRLDQFFGIELNWWPAKIAETAMYLVDHQANRLMEKTLGYTPNRLPIEIAANIHHENALRVDWSEVVLPQPGTNTFLFGNPPFHGHSRLSDEQKADNRAIFKTIDTLGVATGRLDFVACWYVNAWHFLKTNKGQAAFVSTNSITQGEQARALGPLFDSHGFQIDFAHRTFAWTSEATNQAVVHVIIIGFSKKGSRVGKRTIFEYPDLKGAPVRRSADNISIYLAEGENVVMPKRRDSLVPGLPHFTKGFQPTDGGNLIVEPEDLLDVLEDPVAAKYLRVFMQGKQLMQGSTRHCLWLVDASPSDLKSSPVLQKRLEGTRLSRLASPTASVRDAAAIPAQFTQIRQPVAEYFALPEVSSEHRDYVPGAYLDPSIIAGNKLLTMTSPPKWVVGYLQAALFRAWVEMVSGRMKSDISLAPALVYFNFPFQQPEGKSLDDIEGTHDQLFEVRSKYGEIPLGTLYDRLAMPADLLKVHRTLDRLLDGLYGLKSPTEGERLAALLRAYERLNSPLRTT